LARLSARRHVFGGLVRGRDKRVTFDPNLVEYAVVCPSIVGIQMKPFEIEEWALRAIVRVEGNRPNEDTRVELKAEWLKDAARAARRIAGHANAARGNSILWIIGVDEDRGVVGADRSVDFANWWSAVSAQFDGIPPRPTEQLIDRNGVTVIAVVFETDRFPYVVKNPANGQPGGGCVEYEVPWREGTRTRSARHTDLILLLAPLRRLPALDLRSANFRVTLSHENPTTGEKQFHCALTVTVYVLPAGEERVVFPLYRCGACVDFPHPGLRLPLAITSAHTGSAATINVTAEEVVVDGPGTVTLCAISMLSTCPSTDAQTVDAQVAILPAGTDCPMTITVPLKRTTDSRLMTTNVKGAWVHHWP
jgi:hypothetical protein